MRIGIVVETHAGDHSVDLVMTDNGARLTGVQVMTPNGSRRTGSTNLPEIKPKGEKWDISQRNDHDDMIAVVDYVGRMPVVKGFLFPQVNQMLFDDPKVRFDRHQSDVYQSIDGDGNIELHHPSGAYIRIGETPDHVDLSSANTDKGLSIDRNTSRKVHLRVELAGQVARLTMDPTGNCTLELDKTFDLHAKEDIRMKADGDVSIEAGGAMSLKAGSTLDTESGGTTTVKAPTITEDGNTTVTQSFNVDGSTAVKAITSNGKDIGSTHKHLNSGGPALGGVPQ